MKEVDTNEIILTVLRKQNITLPELFRAAVPKKGTKLERTTQADADSKRYRKSKIIPDYLLPYCVKVAGSARKVRPKKQSVARVSNTRKRSRTQKRRSSPSRNKERNV